MSGISLALAAFFLFAAANVAHSQPSSGLISLINVTGQLCCTPTGACPGPPIRNTTVSLVCTNLLGVNVTLGSANTDAQGRFDILVRLLPGLLRNPLVNCRVVVNLPLPNAVCPVLSTTSSVLGSVLNLASILLNGVGGFIFTLIASPFAIL